MTAWTRMDENLFTAEIAVGDSRRYRLTVERLSDYEWDWTVWREGWPAECRYGVVPGRGQGFAAAELAVRRLMREALPGLEGQSAGWLPSGMAGRS